jgi:hypothetical protein
VRHRGATGSGLITAVVAFFAVTAAFIPQASAARENWNHVANIKDAAKRLGELHQREGSAGVIKFLDACYRTQMLASEYSAGLESCLAQDYMHSQVLAQIYARIPQEQRVKTGTPAPEDIARGVTARFVAAFKQYNISAKEADAFKKMLDKDGMPIFLKAVFPPKKAGETDTDGGGEAGAPDNGSGETGGSK